MTTRQSVAKFRNSVRAIGVGRTLLRSARYVQFALGRRELARRTRELLAANTIEERFTRIYESNYWGSSESASGQGSTLEQTRDLRAQLPALLERFRIRSVFDAPCGDFHWMQHVLVQCRVDYVGADIVAPMIDELSRTHAGPATRFVHVDITKGPFPPADLWLCRDCLFHLSYADIAAALRVFVASGIPYILTTTHENVDGYFINTDIRTGDVRRIDLFAAPFHLPRTVLAQLNDGSTTEHPRRMLCLWKRDDVAAALARGRY